MQLNGKVALVTGAGSGIGKVTRGRESPLHNRPGTPVWIDGAQSLLG